MSAAAIVELEQLVSGWQPDFAERVVGADPELVAAIGAKLGAELSPEHQAFLLRMGADSDGLNGYGDAAIDLRAEALLEFVEAELNPDPRAFVIAGVPSDDATPPLMFDRRAQTEPAPLVRLALGDGITPIVNPEHPSLISMLFGFAFTQKCLPRFEWEVHLQSPGTRLPRFPDSPPGRWLPRFAWITAQLGFARVAQTGPWWVCGEHEAAAVMMYECPGFSPDVRVAAHDKVELMRVAELLSDNLELVLRPNSLRQPE
ncbi:hypothetical protein ENSA5_34240 [Enhygromyxa salina]|uniref:Knr4/Smi1-like domain-containing protein n=2 Tax=Enhygromyxa salina TaxID=215803 RepID=A0A2S9XX54_9BACT|nr:hypothetical protein ENSA5_34240 [Enhygromyxa salina]